MKKALLSAIFILFCTTILAQDFKGSVIYRRSDGKTEPLPFAQIYIIEKAKLIETDENGHFTINLEERTTMVATYVGYTKDTLIVDPGVPSGEFYLMGENEVDEAVVTSRQLTNTLSRIKPVRTEVITAAGLCKMACCNLAESFENSASVTVGYSDAITGARQIKLLGLAGTYTQLLDENRPVMRGLASPFGLTYVPGQWLESIQIAKGPSSVINGLEAITGQINMEHRKPTDEVPFFLQLFGSSHAMAEANVASSLQLNEKWSTVILAHASSVLKSIDHNDDGFRDEPQATQFNLSNRWLYYDPSGFQMRFGIRALADDRLGGQMGFERDHDPLTSEFWGSRIKNKGLNGYLKLGIPLNEENSHNIAIVADYNYHTLGSSYGLKTYDGTQKSIFLNLIYQNQLNDHHRISFGLSGQDDDFREDVEDHRTYIFTPVPSPDPITYKIPLHRRERSVGVYGEYNYTLDDKVTFVGSLRGDYNNIHGFLFAPRVTLKYSFTDDIIFRLLGGRGFRTANILADNIGIFSTGRIINVEEIRGDQRNLLEDAWTYGGNITFYLPFGYENNTYISFDYFRNDFLKQVIVDQELDIVQAVLYNLDGKSYTNTYQVDFSIDPIERFNIVTTFRYTDAKVTLRGQGLVERPLTSRFKAVFNAQYATAMNKWTFDFTAQLNGKTKLPNFMAGQDKVIEKDGEYFSPIYPMFFAQITRKFRGIDVYIGGENLGNYRQRNAILNADKPFSEEFNASAIWGPLSGIKIYAGLRLTIWK
ncbi:MAG: TonB-dependent receptor [Bacteroidales bacterium]|jgi:outer membrane receptor for ferrienterochelin and colicins|nr:TonB-dependent receptor [Bacteroidales bacterium]